MVAVQVAVVAAAAVHPVRAMAPAAVPDRAAVLRPTTPVVALVTARATATRDKARPAAGVRLPETALRVSTATHSLRVKMRTWARMAATACHPTAALLQAASPIRCAPAWTACWSAVAVAVVSAAVPVAVEAVPAAAHRAVLAAVAVRAAVTAADLAPGVSHWL